MGIDLLTRFLARLGEIVNILAAVPLASLTYFAAMDRFMAASPPINMDMAIFTSIIFAVLAMGLVNGTLAALFITARKFPDYANEGMPKRAMAKAASRWPEPSGASSGATSGATSGAKTAKTSAQATSAKRNAKTSSGDNSAPSARKAKAKKR